MVPQVVGQGKMRKWHSGGHQKWTGGKEFPFSSNFKISSNGKKGGSRKREGLRSRLTSGLWPVKGSPPQKNKISFSFHRRLGADREQEIITNSQLLFMGYWFITWFYYTCQVLRTGPGTSKALSKCSLALLSPPLSLFPPPYPISGPWYHLAGLC